MRILIKKNINKWVPKFLELWLLIVIVLGLAGCTPVAKDENQGSHEELTASAAEAAKLEDLNYLCDTLAKNHKNLYFKISEEDFAKEKAKIVAKLPNLTEAEFYYELKALVAKVGDAHTDLGFSDSPYSHLRALGFAVSKFGSGWHLAMLEEQNQEYLGYQLVAINKVPIEEVYNRAKSIISLSNEAWGEAQFSNTINFADALKFLGVIEELEQVTLSIQKDKAAPVEMLTLKSMSEAEIMSKNILGLTPKEVALTPVVGIYSGFALTADSYHIQYNSCREDPNLAMKDFVKQVRGDIDGKGYKKIIVDLRYNSGGNSGVFEPMIKALQELQKTNDFTVYTLIGGNTFSSAIFNAVQLQEDTASVLVGSPTGGDVNAYGEIKSFELPNLPVKVFYSTKYFELMKGYDKDSLYPDFAVTQTFEDYMAGVDTVVEAVLAK